MHTFETESRLKEGIPLLASDFGDNVVARDIVTLRMLQTAKSLAPYNATVLVTGETGSGKEVVARTIHRFSNRNTKPWIDVNCAALPEHLVESELFGHERGAFSGADTAKPGLFEMANGGTLFLDEIGEIDPRVQVKLLRVLDSAPYYRLGGTRKVSVDIRLIAATNRDLTAAVEAGTFRRDLYHRITECQIGVPPLRDRPLDIPALATHFLSQVGPHKSLSDEALDLLLVMNWPGNVRELRNVITKLAISAPHEIISAEDVRRYGGEDMSREPSCARGVPDHATTLIAMERLMIVRALESTGGNQSRAAQQLGMPRRTFCRKLDEYQIALRKRRDGKFEEYATLSSYRADLRTTVRILTNLGQSLDAETTDVSAGGMGLTSVPEPLAVGEEIRLRFSLPLQMSPLSATATVAWCRSDGSAGAQFTRVTAAHRAALLRWLSSAGRIPFPETANNSFEHLSA